MRRAERYVFGFGFLELELKQLPTTVPNQHASPLRHCSLSGILGSRISDISARYPPSDIPTAWLPIAPS